MHAPDYFAMHGVSWSSLKHLRDSPLAYRHAMDTPQPDKDAFAIGRAVHALVFEPETFGERFAEWSDGDRRGAKWKAFQSAHEGMTILRADDAALARAIASAVTAHPVAIAHIGGGIVESPVLWVDPTTGLACKARPDCMQPERRILLELKTTRSVEGRRFGAEAARYGYVHQLAHYASGCEHGLGWVPERAIIVAVEKTAPHDVGVFEVDRVAMEIASAEVVELLALLRDCRASDEWPGRYTEVQALQLPAWVYADDDEDDAGGFGLSL